MNSVAIAPTLGLTVVNKNRTLASAYFATLLCSVLRIWLPSNDPVTIAGHSDRHRLHTRRSIRPDSQRFGGGVDDRLRSDRRACGRIDPFQSLLANDLIWGICKSRVVLLVLVFRDTNGFNPAALDGHGDGEVSDVSGRGASVGPVRNAAQVERFECSDVVNGGLRTLLVPFEDGVLLVFSTDPCIGGRLCEYLAVVGDGLGEPAVFAAGIAGTYVRPAWISVSGRSIGQPERLVQLAHVRPKLDRRAIPRGVTANPAELLRGHLLAAKLPIAVGQTQKTIHVVLLELLPPEGRAGPVTDQVVIAMAELTERFLLDSRIVFVDAQHVVHELGALFPSPRVLVDGAKHVVTDMLLGVPAAQRLGPLKVERFRIVQ